MRVRREGGEQRAIFRRTSTGHGYVDYVLVSNANGKVGIGDFYDYGYGRFASDDFHQQALCNAADMSPGFIDRLSPADREFLSFESAVRNMGRLVSTKKFKEAIDVYRGFPDA